VVVLVLLPTPATPTPELIFEVDFYKVNWRFLYFEPGLDTLYE